MTYNNKLPKSNTRSLYKTSIKETLNLFNEISENDKI